MQQNSTPRPFPSERPALDSSRRETTSPADAKMRLSHLGTSTPPLCTPGTPRCTRDDRVGRFRSLGKWVSDDTGKPRRFPSCTFRPYRPASDPPRASPPVQMTADISVTARAMSPLFRVLKKTFSSPKMWFFDRCGGRGCRGYHPPHLGADQSAD